MERGASGGRGRFKQTGVSRREEQEPPGPARHRPRQRQKPHCTFSPPLSALQFDTKARQLGSSAQASASRSSRPSVPPRPPWSSRRTSSHTRTSTGGGAHRLDVPKQLLGVAQNLGRGAFETLHSLGERGGYRSRPVVLGDQTGHLSARCGGEANTWSRSRPGRRPRGAWQRELQVPRGQYPFYLLTDPLGLLLKREEAAENLLQSGPLA